MTLEGEYYRQLSKSTHRVSPVAILMTLEGEYYLSWRLAQVRFLCRNPHDIGRRILHIRGIAVDLFNRRNPHDIGRRILLIRL